MIPTKEANIINANPITPAGSADADDDRYQRGGGALEMTRV